MRKYVLPLLVFVLLLCAGCAGEAVPPTVLTYPEGGSHNSGDLVEPITSSEMDTASLQEDVCNKLDKFVNSGEHNVSLVTTYYYGGMLKRAEVWYNAHSTGEGNKLRVTIICSSEHGDGRNGAANQRAFEAAKKDLISRTDKVTILEILPLYLGDNLGVTLIYYLEK